MEYEELLGNTTNACRVALDLEVRLRESIIRVLASTDSDWWRRLVPADVREDASKRRRSDRESPFANSIEWHQIYYCYLEDLRKIISSKVNRSKFLAVDLRDFESRFSELVALRNRAFHGRLLAASELTRIETLAREMGQLLELSAMPEDLSREDPREIASSAACYLVNVIERLQEDRVPSPPDSLERVLSASSLDLHLQDDAIQQIESIVLEIRSLLQREKARRSRLVIVKFRNSEVGTDLRNRIDLTLEVLRGIR